MRSTVNKKRGTLWTGTSNIVLPVTKQSFPEQFQHSGRLTYYASLFNTVEINSSFYKIPMPVTFQKWSNEVPAGFQFTVKLWRDITHAKLLEFKPADVNLFMKAANEVSNRNKGCLLIQFPASITVDFADKVENILQCVIKTDLLRRWHICTEFRHTSWYTGSVCKMLDKYKISLVLHDMPNSKISLLQTRAAFVYLRFHGTEGDYKGSYNDDLLMEYAQKINNWLQHGKDVYVYFNNTIGNAFENAQSLYKLVSGFDDIK